MDDLHIVVLALVQGLTEFLPVSSSAHLIMAPHLLGWPDQGLAFDVAVHVGTLAAVIGYFQRDLRTMTRAWFASVFGGTQGDDSRLAWAVIFGTIPAGVIGLVLDDIVEAYLRSPLIIAAATVGFGLLLWYASARAKANQGSARDLAKMTWRDVAVVGFMQAIALIPGTSRSGITITAGLLMGLTAQSSARLSFLLSIPLITAAGSLHAIGLINQGGATDWFAISAGSAVAALSALGCIHLFLTLLDRVGMMPFIIYRLVLGGVLFWLFI